MSQSTLTSPSTISPVNAMFSELYALRELFTAPAFGAYSGYTGSNAKLTFDANFNAGYGVAPAGWASTATALDFGARGAFYGSSSGAGASIVENSYSDGTNWRAKGTAAGGILELASGALTLYRFASVSAGSIQTLTMSWMTDASGNLLVGRSTQIASGRLCVQKASGSNNSIEAIQGDAGGYNYYSSAFSNAGTYYHVLLTEAGTSRGSITSNGSATAYNTSSDYRLKTVTGPVSSSGAFIDALNPVRGTWNHNGAPFVGFLAHEVQAVSPSSVIGTKDAVDDAGAPVYQQMEYGSAEFIANIVAELKSLRARVAALEAA